VLHLRAFVANQVMSRIRTYLGLFCPDFYSDIEVFTQILCRYLPKKLAAKTSAPKSNSSTWPGDPHNVYIVSVIIVAF